MLAGSACSGAIYASSANTPPPLAAGSGTTTITSGLSRPVTHVKAMPVTCEELPSSSDGQRRAGPRSGSPLGRSRVEATAGPRGASAPRLCAERRRGWDGRADRSARSRGRGRRVAGVRVHGDPTARTRLAVAQERARNARRLAVRARGPQDVGARGRAVVRRVADVRRVVPQQVGAIRDRVRGGDRAPYRGGRVLGRAGEAVGAEARSGTVIGSVSVRSSAAWASHARARARTASA